MDEKDRDVPEDLIREADNFWSDPRKIMNLIDLLFLWDEDDKERILS